MHHIGWLWKENKKQQNTLNRKQKGDRSRETMLPATECADHAPTLGTSSATENRGRTPEPPGNQPPHLGRQVVTHTGQIRELPPWRVQATRREPVRPWLEAAGPEEAGDPYGEARAFKSPPEKSRSDYKEKPKTNKTKSGKLRRKHRKKSLPNPEP
jgi:hypothetical protein